MNAAEMGRVLGVSPQQVRKYRTRGMPMSSEKSARAWLRKNSMGRFAEKAARACDGAPGTSSAQERDGSASAAASSPDVLAGLSQAELTRRLTAARIRLTERDAAIKSLEERQAQMDADLRDGKLLRAEDEYRKNFERALTLRNKLLALPAEWALQLAAITDPAVAADFTRKRIKQALIEYCASYGVHQADEEPRAA